MALPTRTDSIWQALAGWLGRVGARLDGRSLHHWGS